MKTKRLIYAGLAAMLFSSSLINVPAQVSAAESSSSSNEVNQSSTLEESTTSVSESSKSESDKQSSELESLNKQPSSESILESSDNNTKSSQMKKFDSTKVAQTKSSESLFRDDTIDMGKFPEGNKPSDPSSGGFFLGIGDLGVPLATGFSVQPQAEQYVVASDKVNLDTTAVVFNYLTNISLRIRVWVLQADGNYAVYSLADNTVTSNGSLIPFFNRRFKISRQLPEGSYYIQLSSELDGQVRFSKMAKVTVQKDPVYATGITASTNNAIVFPKTSYPVDAVTNPINSTGDIAWSSTQKDLEFAPQNGRHVDFTPTTDVATINQSTTNPGIPITMNATITNKDSGKTKVKSNDVLVYSGGLKAKEEAQDSGFSWELNGVDQLQNMSPAEGWKYQWHYIANDGRTGILGDSSDKDYVLSDGDKYGVKNSSGEITSISDINNADHILTFTRNSALMAKAAKPERDKKYRFYVTLTPKVRDKDGNLNWGDKDSIINSNLAQLTVTPSTGFLSLDQVPNFSFGNVEANMLYNGVDIASSKIQASDTLQVTDTRATPGWKLSATMSKMSAANNDTLNDTAINLSGLPDAQVTNLVDNNTATDIASSTATGSWPVTGKLALTANPNMNLTKDENFKSNITWTLTSTAPVTKALK